VVALLLLLCLLLLCLLLLCLQCRVASVGEWLKKVTLGYYQYHAVPGNLDHLRVFMHRLRRLWRLVLTHRSQRNRASWDRSDSGPLDSGTVLHPYPMDRFVATHPRWEPIA
jgi:RNA-directed DNA polymerase